MNFFICDLFEYKQSSIEKVNSNFPNEITVDQLESIEKKISTKESFEFVSLSQDVDSLKDFFNMKEDWEDYDSFFVLGVSEGEYRVVYGMNGIVANDFKTLTKLVDDGIVVI